MRMLETKLKVIFNYVILFVAVSIWWVFHKMPFKPSLAAHHRFNICREKIFWNYLDIFFSFLWYTFVFQSILLVSMIATVCTQKRILKLHSLESLIITLSPTKVTITAAVTKAQLSAFQCLFVHYCLTIAFYQPYRLRLYKESDCLTCSIDWFLACYSNKIIFKRIV